MTILPFPSSDSPGPDEQQPGTELAAPPDVPRPGLLRGWLERQPPLPSPTRLKQQARWWVFDGSKKIGHLLLRSPLLALKEAVPVGRGLGRLLGVYARWVAVANWADTVPAAEGTAKTKYGRDLEQMRSNRRRLTLIVVVAVAGVTWWAVEEHPGYVVLTGVGLVCVCDVVGRRGVKKVVTLPPPMKTVRGEGVPLSQITATIVDTALREGLEIGIAQPMRYDAGRREYRVTVTCLDEIKPEHLRAFERGTGFADHTIRNLATDMATIRELVIRDGDPLADVPLPDWLDTATIAQPLPLGASVTENPFAVTFAGIHTAIIGRTGSGKTKGMLWTVIDRLLACRDVVLYGIDLAGGPALPMWRGCIQKTAYTPEDAKLLLDAVSAEIDRRMEVLRELAENDDPDDDQDEWASNLGPALVVVIDEFALVAEHNGDKGKLDLMVLVEKVLRLGRKVWTTLVLATQKAGNSDLGSTVAAAQIGLKILMSCTERDVTMMLGTEMRDAGWAPHLLRPATPGAVNDAGKAYVYGPAHQSPDIYRSFAPITPAEVKRRARQRITDGLPNLSGISTPEDGVIDAIEVSPILAAVERAYLDAGTPKWMATSELLAAIRPEFPALSEKDLAAAIKKPGVRGLVEGRQLRGYLYASIQSAMEEL